MNNIVTILNSSTLHISPDILPLTGRIDQFKGAWQALGSLAPERLLALRLATIESVASSMRLEGSKRSNDEVRTLQLNLQLKQLSTRDEQEVAGELTTYRK
jgi:hypothetical protein